MEAAQRCGALIAAEDVEAAWIVLALLRTRLLALPHRLAPLAHEQTSVADTRTLIRAALREVRHELAETHVAPDPDIEPDGDAEPAGIAHHPCRPVWKCWLETAALSDALDVGDLDAALPGEAVVMPENAFLMIHDPSGLVTGTASDMRAMAEALCKIAAGLIRGYAAKSGKPEVDIAVLMAAETWFDAAEAVEAGFADRLTEPVRVVASFDIARFRNTQPDFVDAAAAIDEPEDARDGPGLRS